MNLVWHPVWPLQIRKTMTMTDIFKSVFKKRLASKSLISIRRLIFPHLVFISRMHSFRVHWFTLNTEGIFQISLLHGLIIIRMPEIHSTMALLIRINFSAACLAVKICSVFAG